MLTIFRRHLKSCPHTSRHTRRCRCPISVEGSLGGETIRKALNLTSWEAAQNVIHEWNWAGKIGGKRPKTCSVADAVALYLKDAVARRLSDGSIARYRAFLERSLLVWCNGRRIGDVRELTFEELTTYRASWTTWSSYTSAKNLELLRMFIRFCVRAKWIEENGALDLKAPKTQMAPTLPFTEEEEAKILATCEQYRTHNKHGKRSPVRLRAFCLAMRYSGLRVGDVATLETRRLEANKLLLYVHKTNVPVYVPIPEYVADELREAAKVNSNLNYFFWSGRSTLKCASVTWQRALKTLFRKAGVPHGHPHMYRDTFATALLLQNVAIEDVALLLGHSDPRVTWKHYSAFVQARRMKLEEAVAKTWKLPTVQLRLVKN